MENGYVMDKFDMFWPISDEEIEENNIHVNDHPAENCSVCQENARIREERKKNAPPKHD